MKKLDTQAVDAALDTLNDAREMVCRGTAGLERLREVLDQIEFDEEVGDRLRTLLAASLDRLYQGPRSCKPSARWS
jgi:hypothetical protein